MRWDSAGIGSDLGALAGDPESQARDCTPDGSIIVGHSFDPNVRNHAVRLTPAGIDDLGALEPDLLSSAWGVSADGSVVVGTSGSRAFIWTLPTGMVDLGTYLAGLGIDLGGWTLTEAKSISADGRTIVGNGFSPLTGGAWIATIPAPPGVLVLAALLATGRRRR